MSDGGQGTGSDAAGDDRGPDGREVGDNGAQQADSESGSEQPAGIHGAYAVETPQQLLGEIASVRRQARLARHGYWLPLVLFGLLTCASIPFYIVRLPASGAYVSPSPAGPAFLRSAYLGGFGILTGRYIPYYWLAAILVGVAATAVWYRWRGNRVGLRTAARGYLITGAVLLLAALAIPALAVRAVPGLRVLMPGDLLIRGTFPLVVIGIGLCYLAWAERSVALTVIAAGYLVLSLVASLYDVGNVFYRLGWNLSPELGGTPNVVLPALVLLLSGAGAWEVQRRYETRPASLPYGEAS